MTPEEVEEFEKARTALASEINSAKAGWLELEAAYGQVWNTQELQRDFTVTSFLAPYVFVIRKIDNVRGVMLFQHDPRYYFSFKEI